MDPVRLLIAILLAAVAIWLLPGIIGVVVAVIILIVVFAPLLRSRL